MACKQKDLQCIRMKLCLAISGSKCMQQGYDPHYGNRGSVYVSQWGRTSHTLCFLKEPSGTGHKMYCGHAKCRFLQCSSWKCHWE